MPIIEVSAPCPICATVNTFAVRTGDPFPKSLDFDWQDGCECAISPYVEQEKYLQEMDERIRAAII